MTYLVIGNIVLDILDAAVIPHSYIMQGGMVKSGVLSYASGKFKFLIERSYPDIS